MKNHPENFFCTLCWRPRLALKDQSKFCNLHTTIDDSKEYKRRRRRLENLASERKLDIEVDKIVSKLCNVIKSPDTLYKQLVSNSSQMNWGSFFREMHLQSSTHYKNTAEIINKIGFIKSNKNGETVDLVRPDSPLDFAQLLIRHFDQKNPNAICDDYQHLSQDMSIDEQYRTLLHLIARLEVDSRFGLEKKIRRGPKTVSKYFNAQVYTDLLQAIEEHKEYTITIRISEIAKRHGISKQAVHEKLVRVIANKEHYRKHILEFKKLNKKT